MERLEPLMFLPHLPFLQLYLNLLMERLEPLMFLPHLPFLQLYLLASVVDLTLSPKHILLETMAVIFELRPCMLERLLVVAIRITHALLESEQSLVLGLEALALKGQGRAVIDLAVLHVPYKLRDPSSLIL